MSLVTDRKTAQGTEDTQITFNIFDRESTKNGSPISKTFNLSYSKIQNAWLKVQLLADTVGSISGLPAFLGGGYELTKIIINGKEFKPSNSQDSTNLIQDMYSINYMLENTLNGNDGNTISIHFTAPTGAGVISPNAQINAQLIVLGTETVQSKIGLTGLPSVSDLGSQIQNWINNNVPTFIENFRD